MGLRKTWNMKCGVALYSMAARNIDPLNPKRMRLRRKPLFFDKKNYNISLPFKEKILGDKFRENELMEKYGEEMERRVLDPLLMEDKMRKFQRVFYQLSRSPETPKKVGIGETEKEENECEDSTENKIAVETDERIEM